MDVRISDGDIAVLSCGSYEYISGIEEAVQRVRLSAMTVKGDFIYDRELGTDYRGIQANEPMQVKKLDMVIKEACADIYGTQVEVLRCEQGVAVIRVDHQQQFTTTEVDLSGILQ